MTYGYHKHSVGVVTVDPSNRILQSYCNRCGRTGSIEVANANIIFTHHLSRTSNPKSSKVNTLWNSEGQRQFIVADWTALQITCMTPHSVITDL